MERDGLAPFFLADPTGGAKGEELVVDPGAEFDRHGDAIGVRDRCAYDVREEPRLHGDRRAAALSCHLAHRATEIHVDVIDTTLTDEALHGFADVIRVHSVE